MRILPISIAALLLLFTFQGLSQIDFTANDQVPEYSGHFLFGSNMGYYAPWTDEQLADIAIGNPEHNLAGAGINALRPSLPNHFLEQWGYDIRINTFKHYSNLGAKENVIFVGFPAQEFRETTRYCQNDGDPSHHFKNLYTPIWDNGENGTPVNDNNHLALYLYKTVTRYKDYAKFWEIWNEPDFDYTGNALRAPGEQGNWWDNDPNPCDYKMKAPVQHYVRTLRISYEVIKSITPESFVAVGGLGYPSFLDAVLRNTDNPENGIVSNEFPLKGGAYFDVLSFHSYPHIDGSLRTWNNTLNGFSYKRHSDQAVNGVFQKRDEFKTVLENYGYNGADFPGKKWIITEANIPAKTVGEYIGSPEAQVNFLIKCLVKSKMENIIQFDVYNLAEDSPSDGVPEDFKRMGLFKPLTGITPYEHEIIPAGIAYKTTADLLKENRFNKTKTDLLQLPGNIDGGAFTDDSGTDVYVLWAKTTEDRSELANAIYRFPETLVSEELTQMEWDFSQTKNTRKIKAGESVRLSGAPAFFKTTQSLESHNKIIATHPNPFVDSTVIHYQIDESQNASLELFDINGKKIKSLFHQDNHASGKYTFSWHDENLPSGVYYLCLFSGNNKSCSKVVKLYR